MKKKFYFVLLIFVILVAFGLIYITEKREKQKSGTGSDSSDGKLEIKTESGELFVENFKKNAEITEGGLVYFVDKADYNICYNSTSNEFIVTLLKDNNIETVRKEAENDLLSSLEISREEACRLNIFLYVSAAINEKLSQNHGLSFCAGSLPFIQ